jgi:hypothetical protein
MPFSSHAYGEYFLETTLKGHLAVNVLPKKIEVVGYSGYKANERPLYFVLDEERLHVQNIIDRWYGVEHDYFKVTADDGKVYLLKWQRSVDLWFVEKILDRLGKH